MYQPKESVPHHQGGMNGVVHHALAFNTLLSSQETDAFPATQTRRPGNRGVPFCFILFFRCALILSDPLFLVKPVRFQPIDSTLLILIKFRPPRFQGNPSNLPASERLC